MITFLWSMLKMLIPFIFALNCIISYYIVKFILNLGNEQEAPDMVVFPISLVSGIWITKMTLEQMPF